MSTPGSRGVDIDFQALNAKKFLDQKVRETIAKCDVAGLAAVLVSQGGERLIYSTLGKRKLGASGTENEIKPQDRFCLGSLSKPVTGTLIGILIQKGIGNLSWTTKLKDVFPEIQSIPGAKPQYFHVTLEQLMAHSSGMGYNALTEPGDQWFPAPAALGLNDANLMERRRKFVYASVLDEPLFPAGTGKEYGGGTIICAAMVEKRTGVRFEHLLTQHLYGPLGMSNSGWGVTSPGALNGPWQHHWDDADYALRPNDSTHAAPYNYQSHGVAGALATAAPDMGRFMRENLRPDPQVMTTATRDTLQAHLPAAGSDTTRGAWVCSTPSSPATSSIWHNGDNGTMYSNLKLFRAAHWGSAAFSNVNSRFGKPAVSDMQETMKAMMNHWEALFTDGDVPFWECAHPQPALTRAGHAQWLFTRKHTGALVRRALPVGGAPLAPVEFPGGIHTSGVAAAASGDGLKIQVLSRGTDNRIWRAWSTNGGSSWQGFAPILSGTFLSGPAVAMSAGGDIIHAFATGTDSRMYRTRSINGGGTWSEWQAIGAGVFTSQPAAACSLDGKIVHTFGRGLDRRIWRNVSIHSGSSWQTHWTPIGPDIFTTGPAAACNNSGSTVHVVARGTDRAMWRNVTTDSGADWGTWQEIPDGSFNSAPSVELSEDGMTLSIVALGGDFCPWLNRAGSGLRRWDGWTKIGSEYYL